MNPPDPIEIDDRLQFRCVDDGPEPYVDVCFDSLPPTEDDPDYSEEPELLRRAAAWLVAAADWLEGRQG
jgi:hypothetical protein